MYSIQFHNVDIRVVNIRNVCTEPEKDIRKIHTKWWKLNFCCCCFKNRLPFFIPSPPRTSLRHRIASSDDGHDAKTAAAAKGAKQPNMGYRLCDPHNSYFVPPHLLPSTDRPLLRFSCFLLLIHSDSLSGIRSHCRASIWNINEWLWQRTKPSNPTTSFPIYFSQIQIRINLTSTPDNKLAMARLARLLFVLSDHRGHNQHVTGRDSISSWSVNYWQYPETLILIRFPREVRGWQISN